MRTCGSGWSTTPPTHRSLAREHITDQAEVDWIFGSLLLAVDPKGVNPETADVVERVLRSAQDSLSAAECADLVGISRVSARLEHFLKQGKVKVSLRYGTAGRPERRYGWRRA